MHITIRLAWHNNGWNGHICSDPEKNTYCIGRSSYPGDLIKETRDIKWETRNDVKGKPCGSLKSGRPACGCSINAFGFENTKASVSPPIWFGSEVKPALIDTPPSTVCIWNYEGMYSDDVLRAPGMGQKYNYDFRLNNAIEYFDNLRKDEGKGLIFYYANYSNPFSEEEEQKYVIVGISRLKKVGKIHYYEGTSDEIKKKYAGGFVWQMPITSNYPDEGFVIPYHKYMDNPDVLGRILLVPDNSRNFKYATRPVSDDDALVLVERMIEIVSFLLEIGDDTQDWSRRREWLLKLIGELWQKRGAFPGFPEVLYFLGFNEGIEYYRNETEQGNSVQAYYNVIGFIKGEQKSIQGITLSPKRETEIVRNWKLIDKAEQQLLSTIYPRFALSIKQIKSILNAHRFENNIYASLEEIIENPYILCEQYIGENSDDVISFHLIDHGVLPNPDLGIECFFSKNSPQRFRALCVDVLKRESIHSFVSGENVLLILNNRLNFLPEWKNHQFTNNYFIVDSEFIERSITYRTFEGKTYLYLNDVRNDEKLIHTTLKDLNRGEIQFKITIDEKHFYNLLKDPQSQLIEKASKEYDIALQGQASVCSKVFNKPVCVISGAAGTGKTTILKSIIQSIEKAHGATRGLVLLAPTGKAAVRLTEKTGRQSYTIHSFLASRNWLNDNYTFRRSGNQDDEITTLIIDECSMIDLSLFATLLRSINWNGVQRLILVGDPNQLPPIGKGKVFNDIIDWMKKAHPDNLGRLDVNVRQLENTVNKKGNGILDLADIFIQEKQSVDFNKSHREEILKKVQQGGQIDKDLSVFYWKDMVELESLLKSVIFNDLKILTKETNNNDLIDLWRKVIRTESQYPNPSYFQMLSPYRGEFYGTDYLNTFFQDHFNGFQAKKTQLDGISLYDKIIQYRNRPLSNKISAYSFKQGKNVKIDIYNGELGFVYPHAFDKDYVSRSSFTLKKFQVKFERRDDFLVNYGYCEGSDKRTLFNEPADENLELGYVISVHKAQGSEFNRVYLVLPKKRRSLISMELMYTAITRAQKNLTIFAQEDISTFIDLTKVEKSSIRKINSSIFEFKPIPDELFSIRTNWYEDQRVISTLSDYFVRSKSEMNIANILYLNEIPFKYEVPKYSKDGTMYLPDFTITWRGEEYYWEHLGRLDLTQYKNHWEIKNKWYEKNFPGRLITTFEGDDQTIQIREILKKYFDIILT